MVEIQPIEMSEIAKTKQFVVVGIPAFNEEQTIARVILEAQKFSDKVIVCDDGSIDYTAKIAESLGADVVRHEKNGGVLGHAGEAEGDGTQGVGAPSRSAQLAPEGAGGGQEKKCGGGIGGREGGVGEHVRIEREEERRGG